MLVDPELASAQGAVIVIEDDFNIPNLGIEDVVYAVLHQGGFTVHAAATGLTGLELVCSI